MNKQTMEFLSNYKITKNDLEKLSNYSSRDGFVLVEKEEFENVLETFALQGMVCHLSHDDISLEPKFLNIARLISAIEKNPKAWDYYDFLELGVFDFTINEDSNLLANRESLVNQLHSEFQSLDEAFKQKEEEFTVANANLDLDSKESINNRNNLLNDVEALEQLRQQAAFALMSLTSKKDIESIVRPLLNHDDDYINERANKIIAFHNN